LLISKKPKIYFLNLMSEIILFFIFYRFEILNFVGKISLQGRSCSLSKGKIGFTGNSDIFAALILRNLKSLILQNKKCRTLSPKALPENIQHIIFMHVKKYNSFSLFFFSSPFGGPQFQSLP